MKKRIKQIKLVIYFYYTQVRILISSLLAYIIALSILRKTFNNFIDDYSKELYSRKLMSEAYHSIKYQSKL
jgi:hypothetical protein